jgi:shikimate dehydrogenase
VIGAGGAARAVVLALAQAGAAEVVVVNRTLDRGRAAAALAGAVGRTGQAAEIADMDLVVHATPVGMTAGAITIEGSPGRAPLVQPDRFGPGQVLVDLVYHPATTALMEAARRRGATVVNGVGMLVHQAALAFELWTGRDAPLAVMRAAATEVLQSRGA